MIFIVELIAFRWGTSKLAKLGLSHDNHGHGLPAHASHGPEPDNTPRASNKELDLEAKIAIDGETDNPDALGYAVATQIIGIAILEFGVILHR